MLSEISAQLQAGNAKLVKELVEKAITNGLSAQTILNDGLLAGMDIIGKKFKAGEIYVPEVLMAARAMNTGAMLLKSLLINENAKNIGKACIGTVFGDKHDIGKNLVKMMLESKGIEVVDLGTNVAAESFVKTAIEQSCDIICASALLTTTMPVMEEIVKCAESEGIRSQVKIMIGGAPVTEEFCKRINADAYTPDAVSAAERAYGFLTEGK